MKREIPVTLVIALVLVIVAIVASMALIRPKRAEADRLGEDIAALETKVAAARVAARQRSQGTTIKVADLFQLSKAMPDEDDMAGVILELNSVASSTGIRFVGITPLAPAAKEGYRTVPIDLIFHGNYFDLTDFLFRLRNLVTVRDGVLDASGRLFTLDSIDFHEGPKKFPQIEAVLKISAYVYGDSGTLPAPAPSAPTPTTTATTTGTTTSTTTTTPTPATDGSQEAVGGLP